MEDASFFVNKQRDHNNSDFHKLERKKIHETWFRDDTVDYWRHLRMYNMITPIANYYHDKEWLTVGDGRYGLDSFRLKKLFNIKAFPTDISENMLKKGFEMGLVDNYSVENAEQLSFETNSFDIVFCKEAFHHFPRPIVALYEMLRVAKIAVILIEPNDSINFESINKRKYLSSAIKILVNKLLKRKFSPYVPNIYFRNISFEESGNFAYALSNQELNKIVHGLDLGGLVYKTFNDCYIKGCEFEKAEENSKMFNKVKTVIETADKNKRQDLTASIIFKTKIDNSLTEAMVNHGFTIAPKVKNPYTGN